MPPAQGSVRVAWAQDDRVWRWPVRTHEGLSRVLVGAVLVAAWVAREAPASQTPASPEREPISTLEVSRQLRKPRGRVWALAPPVVAQRALRVLHPAGITTRIPQVGETPAERAEPGEAGRVEAVRDMAAIGPLDLRVVQRLLAHVAHRFIFWLLRPLRLRPLSLWLLWLLLGRRVFRCLLCGAPGSGWREEACEVPPPSLWLRKSCGPGAEDVSEGARLWW